MLKKRLGQTQRGLPLGGHRGVSSVSRITTTHRSMTQKVRRVGHRMTNLTVTILVMTSRVSSNSRGGGWAGPARMSGSSSASLAGLQAQQQQQQLLAGELGVLAQGMVVVQGHGLLRMILILMHLRSAAGPRSGASSTAGALRRRSC
jgi:hypothetical protein